MKKLTQLKANSRGVICGVAVGSLRCGVECLLIARNVRELNRLWNATNPAQPLNLDRTYCVEVRRA